VDSWKVWIIGLRPHWTAAGRSLPMVWNLQVWVLRRHWAGLGVLDRPWRSFGQGAQQGLLHHSPTALHTVIPFLSGSQCQSATGWPHRHSQPGRASDRALQQASVALLSRLSHSTRPSYKTRRLQYGRLVVQYEVNSSTLAACVQYSTVQYSPVSDMRSVHLLCSVVQRDFKWSCYLWTLLSAPYPQWKP